MADNTGIEWADATWQITTGCSVVSPGCTNCYAMRLAGTRLQHHPSRKGLTIDTKAGPVWTGEVRFNEQWLDQPLRWRRPRRIFVSAHGDLFHENLPDEAIDRVFAVMALCPQHTFMVLTKRAERMREYLTRHDVGGRLAIAISHKFEPPTIVTTPQEAVGWSNNGFPNVMLGVSVEDQSRADERIPVLLDTPAAKRFISTEPLLSAIDLTNILIAGGGKGRDARLDALNAAPSEAPWHQPLDWVITGGESGPGARPMHPDWARSLRDQCQAAGVPFFFKQWGAYQPSARGIGVIAAGGSGPFTPDVAWPDGTIGAGDEETRGGQGTSLYRVGKKAAGRRLDGRKWSEFPA